jgi:hypothetical protein
MIFTRVCRPAPAAPQGSQEWSADPRFPIEPGR